MIGAKESVGPVPDVAYESKWKLRVSSTGKTQVFVSIGASPFPLDPPWVEGTERSRSREDLMYSHSNPSSRTRVAHHPFGGDGLFSI